MCGRLEPKPHRTRPKLNPAAAGMSSQRLRELCWTTAHATGGTPSPNLCSFSPTTATACPCLSACRSFRYVRYVRCQGASGAPSYDLPTGAEFALLVERHGCSGSLFNKTRALSLLLSPEIEHDMLRRACTQTLSFPPPNPTQRQSCCNERRETMGLLKVPRSNTRENDGFHEKDREAT